jgi:hypothetical protein
MTEMTITLKTLPGTGTLISIPNPSSALNPDTLDRAIAAGDVEVIDRAIAQLQAISQTWKITHQMRGGNSPKN